MRVARIEGAGGECLYRLYARSGVRYDLTSQQWERGTAYLRSILGHTLPRDAFEFRRAFVARPDRIHLLAVEVELRGERPAFRPVVEKVTDAEALVVLAQMAVEGAEAVALKRLKAEVQRRTAEPVYCQREVRCEGLDQTFTVLTNRKQWAAGVAVRFEPSRGVVLRFMGGACREVKGDVWVAIPTAWIEDGWLPRGVLTSNVFNRPDMPWSEEDLQRLGVQDRAAASGTADPFRLGPRSYDVLDKVGIVQHYADDLMRWLTDACDRGEVTPTTYEEGYVALDTIKANESRVTMQKVFSFLSKRDQDALFDRACILGGLANF